MVAFFFFHLACWIRGFTISGSRKGGTVRERQDSVGKHLFQCIVSRQFEVDYCDLGQKPFYSICCGD